MLTTTIRVKLVVFVLLTVSSLSYVYIQYMQGLERAGVGVYHVSMELPEAGGLYTNAQVSYRGVDVGLVTNLEVTTDRVVATLTLDDDHPVPSDLDAYVRSTSAIGEQYVDLVPRVGNSIDERLDEGDLIEQGRVTLPVSTAAFLANGEALLGSVSARDVDILVDELGAAFANSTGDLRSLMASSIALQAEATENLTPTMRLLDDLQVVLGTQHAMAPEAATYLRQLREFTDTLVAKDADIRKLLADGSPFLDQLDAQLSRLRPHLAPLLNDTRTVGNVLKTYDGNMEHMLTTFPALVAALQSTVPKDRLDDRMPLIKIAFKTSINSPPTCTTGFADADKERSPHDLSPAPAPSKSWCKIAPDDPRIPRGVRNIPCPTAGGRGATPELCGLTFPRYRTGGTQHVPERILFVDPIRDKATTEDGEVLSMHDLATRTTPDDWLDLMLGRTGPPR